MKHEKKDERHVDKLHEFVKQEKPWSPIQISQHNPISFEVSSWVDRNANGKFYWALQFHIKGPDDVITRRSKFFDNPELAFKDMWENFSSMAFEVLKEFGDE